MLRPLALAALLALAASPALAQSFTYPKVPGPGGSVYPNPTFQWNPNCNGGSGGYIGQTYSNVVCNPDTNNASYAAPVTINVGAPALSTPVRDIDAECTAGGSVTVTFASGTSVVWQVSAGSQDKPWQATGISSVSGASCVYYGFTK